MITVKIRPLTVNQAWQGRRFKTPAYSAYEKELFYLLPPCSIPGGDLEVFYEFGLSSSLADWDNPIKPMQDVLQKRYRFDDRRIVRAEVVKVKVDRGQEYIKFEIRKAA